MAANNYLDTIYSCIRATYCKAKQNKCVGKDVRESNLLLKKLVMAKWLAEQGEGWAVACFLKMNCRGCIVGDLSEIPPTTPTPPTVETFYLLREDGSRITREDGSGFILRGH
jgi:hypothetical protein